MIEKPPYGSPCNSCGLCCENQLCPLGASIFGTWNGPCPALVSESDGKRICGVVKNPGLYASIANLLKNGASKMSEAALVLIGHGVGCDAQVEDEPDNPEFRRRMRQYSSRERVQADRALLAWDILRRLPPGIPQ